MSFRPLVETPADTWRWLSQTGGEDEARRVAARKLPIPAGLPAQRERQLLAEWAAR